MAKQRYNDEYEYEIFDDGYEIYGKAITIAQHEPYARPYDRYKSYEENCMLQLEDLSTQPDPSTDAEKLRADLDYMSLMLDVPLPSEEEEGE